MNKCIIQGRSLLLILFLVFIIGLPSIINAESDSSQNELLNKSFETDQSYERAILWGERFYRLHLNSLSLKQYEKANKLKPAAYFPVYRINQLRIKMNQPLNTNLGFAIFDFNKPGILITVLLFVILFSLTSMVLALTTVLFNRNKMIREEKRKQFMREEYQTMLVNYLFAKEKSEDIILRFKQVTSTKAYRRILIDQMIDLSITLTGLEKERLKELYVTLRLDKDSHRKAFHRKWHIKAKGFRELAFMDIHSANEEIIHCLSSKNDILRMEAQFAMVRLNPDNSFGFLDFLEKRFTLWEQLNVYETITFHHLELPNFEKWLLSKNKSVVLFALRMISVFKQTSTYNTLIQLLTHSDAEIRHQAITVIGNLKLVEALPHLKRIYKNETYGNCIAIIQTNSRIPDPNMLGFLKLVLDKEDDVQLQIEAAMAINKMGEIGSTALNKLLNSDYKNYQIIIKHVLDKRIN
jgi:hypothetical protein